MISSLPGTEAKGAEQRGESQNDEEHLQKILQYEAKNHKRKRRKSANITRLQEIENSQKENPETQYTQSHSHKNPRANPLFITRKKDWLKEGECVGNLKKILLPPKKGGDVLGALYCRREKELKENERNIIKIRWPQISVQEKRAELEDEFLISQYALHLQSHVKVAMTTESGNNECLAWAARDPSGILSPYKFSRRVPGPDDVSLKITHCGVCYADVIWKGNKIGDFHYPLVPGHEIVGIVKEVGSSVKSFKVGDRIGVGTYVNSCRDCDYCNDRLEVYCAKFPTLTFNALDVDGTITKGGYSSHIVVHERQLTSRYKYCYRIPDDYPLASAAPLLCAGITVYSPMMRHKMNQPGKALGVIGLGGLGHMAVKFGKAFGLSVTILSTSKSKKEEALTLLGADRFVVSSEKQQMEDAAKSLDFIVDTASGDHSFDQYMPLLKTSGILALVGFPSMKTISGSIAGGTKETQEMIDFCAAHKIYPNIEVINIQYINEALERLVNKDVKYRFVIDVENSLK
ncbi:cinnamoyl-Coa reductase [Asimina triloba]